VSDAPLLRVVQGRPDDAELAALVAVLVAGSGTAEASTAGPAPRWRDRARSVHAPVQHGPGAWRASGLPQ
jgi:hypothetical protein